MAVK
jgi:hypothetical protein